MHFAVTVPAEATADELYERYRHLYEQAVAACRRYEDDHPEETLIRESDHEGSSAVISYNLALTTSAMVICPRRREGAVMKSVENDGGKLFGPIAINGTILAGTLMVKSEEEWNEMRRQASHLYDLLQAIGIPVELDRESVNGRL